MRTLAAGGTPVERLERWLDDLVDLLGRQPELRAACCCARCSRTTTWPARCPRRSRRSARSRASWAARRLAAARGHGQRRLPRRQRAAPALDAGRPDRLPLRVRRLRRRDPRQGRVRPGRGAAAQARDQGLRPLRSDRQAGRLTARAILEKTARKTSRSSSMEKILAEYRKKIGEFEVVEVDEARVAALRAQLDVDVPIDLHWTWEYGSEVEELRALYERGKKGQWNAEEDIDWARRSRTTSGSCRARASMLLPTILTDDGRRRGDLQARRVSTSSRYTLSQLLHGEQAALQLCGQLTNACPTMDAKFYAGSQVDRRGAPRRGAREVPAAQDGHDLPDRPDAQGAARQAARGADLEDQDARHADALRGHGGRHLRPCSHEGLDRTRC